MLYQMQVSQHAFAKSRTDLDNRRYVQQNATDMEVVLYCNWSSVVKYFVHLMQKTNGPPK